MKEKRFTLEQRATAITNAKGRIVEEEHIEVPSEERISVQGIIATNVKERLQLHDV